MTSAKSKESVEVSPPGGSSSTIKSVWQGREATLEEGETKDPIGDRKSKGDDGVPSESSLVLLRTGKIRVEASRRKSHAYEEPRR